MKKLLITIIIAVFTLQLICTNIQPTALSSLRQSLTHKKILLNIFNRTFDSVAYEPRWQVYHWSESEMEEPTEQPTVWYGLGPWERI